LAINQWSMTTVRDSLLAIASAARDRNRGAADVAGVKLPGDGRGAVARR